MDMHNCIGLQRGVPARAMDEGVMDRQLVEGLAHGLFGALIEAAIGLAPARDRTTVRAESG